MFSYISNLLWGSSEDRLIKFRVMVSLLRAELTKLENTRYYMVHYFSIYIKEPRNKKELREKANDLSLLIQKCEAYEKVSKAASELIQRWELFDNNMESIAITNALNTMHNYKNFIEQKEMINWIQKVTTKNDKTPKEYEMINDENLVGFIKSFCKDQNIAITNNYIKQ